MSLFYFHNYSCLLIKFKVQVTSENSESIAPFSSFYRAAIEKSNAILILDPLTAKFFFLSRKFENTFVPNFKMRCFGVALHSSTMLGLNGVFLFESLNLSVLGNFLELLL